MVSTTIVAALVGFVLSFSTTAFAGFNSRSQTNIAIYWGQNSAGQATSQQRLASYCTNTPVNIIPIAFLIGIKSPTLLNVASASASCTLFPGTQLLRCPTIEADIKTCQSLGKTILLSLGGATYAEGGFSSPAEATQWANTIWAMFGPRQPFSSALRPFGSAVLDGFDFDFESPTTNMVPFAARLRALMDAAQLRTGKKYYLSAAPQCPIPDVALDSVLQAVPLDFVSVQFYNNYCGAPSFDALGAGGSGDFNFAAWDAWARTSRNVNVKVLLGVPGSATAAGSGYVSPAQLGTLVAYSKRFSSFGGVMIWDMSQVYYNGGGRVFLNGVANALRARPSSTTTRPPVTTSTTPPVPSSTTTSRRTTVTARPRPTYRPQQGLNQWQQCGGIGYTGPRVCRAPYRCVRWSEWWSHCK